MTRIVLIAQDPTLNREHTAEKLELRNHIPIHAVNVIAVKMLDERFDRTIETGERMWPVILADRGNLVVPVTEVDQLGGHDGHDIPSVVSRQPRERHSAWCRDMVDGGAASREIEPLRAKFRA